VVPDRSKRLAPVSQLFDLLQSCDCVARHPSPPTLYVTYCRDLDDLDNGRTRRHETSLPSRRDNSGKRRPCYRNGLR
jgi:hypothetical protein